MPSLINNVSQMLASPQFTKQTATIVAEEFVGLLKQALNDSDTFINTSAKIAAQALLDRAQGELDEEDMTTLLNKQKTIARIHANSCEIALRTRIQTITMRLIELALNTVAPGLK